MSKSSKTWIPGQAGNDEQRAQNRIQRRLHLKTGLPVEPGMMQTYRNNDK
jgi:hypothetical protein